MSLRHYSNSKVIQGRCKALIVSAHSLSCPGLLTPVFKMTDLFSWEYGSGQAKASSDRSNYSGSPRWYDRQEVSSPLLLYCVDHMTWIHLRRADWWTGSNFIKLCTAPLTWIFFFICCFILLCFKLCSCHSVENSTKKRERKSDSTWLMVHLCRCCFNYNSLIMCFQWTCDALGSF